MFVLLSERIAGVNAPDERAKSTSSLTPVRSAHPTPGDRRAVLLFCLLPIPASAPPFPILPLRAFDGEAGQVLAEEGEGV